MSEWQADFSLLMQAIIAVAVAVSGLFGYLNNRLARQNKDAIADVHTLVNGNDQNAQDDIRRLTATITSIAQSKGP